MEWTQRGCVVELVSFSSWTSVLNRSDANIAHDCRIDIRDGCKKNSPIHVNAVSGGSVLGISNLLFSSVD